MADHRTHYFPFHRCARARAFTRPRSRAHPPPPPRSGEKYPRQLSVDFRKMRVQTLRKYAEVFEVVVRPDLTPNELSIAVARCGARARVSAAPAPVALPRSRAAPRARAPPLPPHQPL